jgi:hypothetical protein
VGGRKGFQAILKIQVFRLFHWRDATMSQRYDKDLTALLVALNVTQGQRHDDET